MDHQPEESSGGAYAGSTGLLLLAVGLLESAEQFVATGNG